MTVAVVVPTIREDCALRWLEEWKDDLAGARVILVEDNPEPTFAITGADHYSWADIRRELGADEWMVSRRTAACGAFGYLKALQGGADIIWTLSDDCYPEEARKGTYLEDIRECLAAGVASADVMNGWWNTTARAGIYPRGYPYRTRDNERPVMVHHGLWSNIPDLDGITQLARPDLRLDPAQHVDVVPEGALFPFCIMNVAFRAEAAPVMYTLLMGQDQHGEPVGVRPVRRHLVRPVHQAGSGPSRLGCHVRRPVDPSFARLRPAPQQGTGSGGDRGSRGFLAVHRRRPPVRHYGGRVLPGTR